MTQDPKRNNPCPRCGHYMIRSLCDGRSHCYACGYWGEPEEKKKK